ncbi:MAG: hypothetical protein CMB53_03360 [Euryarchaeota archaeon]|nr:hypothetical protein [Euryarchaeota archaeon]|tara:strand:+ start:26988 stop:27506 length:519 start_codon:yes stop_codon:yes gene_type:complete
MGTEVRVSTIVQPHEDPEMVVLAVRNVFPDWMPSEEIGKRSFPHSGSVDILHGKVGSMDTFVEAITNQRILDTALDAMTIDMEGSDYTDFSISRQAALAGKISFSLGERAAGGTIDVSIQGDEIDQWLEKLTWHQGRAAIPRKVGDGLSMAEDGTPIEWFDKRGRPTIGEDD